MSRICLRLIPALAVGIVASQLFAQQGGGMRGGQTVSAMMLLTNKGVIEELKLTEEQQEKVKSAMKDLRDKYKDDLTAARQDREKRDKLNKEMGTEFHKTAVSTLKPEQMKRLHQVELQAGLQVMGPSALLSPHVEKELKLTDQQKTAIKEASEALTLERQELMKDIGKDQDKRQEAMTKMRTKTKEMTAKVVKSLDSDQQKTLKEMEGASFEYRPMFGGRQKQ